MNTQLFATFCVFSFYSRLIPHYFPFPRVSLQLRVCLSRQLRICLGITLMIIPSSFAKIVVMPDVVFPLLFQHWSTSTFQPMTCVLILSSHPASLLLTQSRNNPFGLTMKIFFMPYLARKIFLIPHPCVFAVFLYLRTPRGKPKFTRPDVCILDSEVPSRASALYVRLAYTTVDSYVGKLRSIFSDIGRQGDWNRTNPASDLLVKQYLKEVTAEQLRARITPKQAVPLFLTNCFRFPDTSKSVFSFRPFHRLRCSSLLEIKLSSRFYSFPVIEVVIWGKSIHLSLLVSRTTTDSCLIMFGVRP